MRCCYLFRSRSEIEDHDLKMCRKRLMLRVPENIFPGAHKSQMSLKMAGKGEPTGQAWKSGFVSQLTPQPHLVVELSMLSV